MMKKKLRFLLVFVAVNSLIIKGEAQVPSTGYVPLPDVYGVGSLRGREEDPKTDSEEISAALLASSPSFLESFIPETINAPSSTCQNSISQLPLEYIAGFAIDPNVRNGSKPPIEVKVKGRRGCDISDPGCTIDFSVKTEKLVGAHCWKDNVKVEIKKRMNSQQAYYYGVEVKYRDKAEFKSCMSTVHGRIKTCAAGKQRVKGRNEARQKYQINKYVPGTDPEYDICKNTLDAGNVYLSIKDSEGGRFKERKGNGTTNDDHKGSGNIVYFESGAAAAQRRVNISGSDQRHFEMSNECEHAFRIGDQDQKIAIYGQAPPSTVNVGNNVVKIPDLEKEYLRIKALLDSQNLNCSALQLTSNIDKKNLEDFASLSANAITAAKEVYKQAINEWGSNPDGPLNPAIFQDIKTLEIDPIVKEWQDLHRQYIAGTLDRYDYKRKARALYAKLQNALSGYTLNYKGEAMNLSDLRDLRKLSKMAQLSADGLAPLIAGEFYHLYEIMKNLKRSSNKKSLSPEVAMSAAESMFDVFATRVDRYAEWIDMVKGNLEPDDVEEFSEQVAAAKQDFESAKRKYRKFYKSRRKLRKKLKEMCKDSEYSEEYGSWKDCYNDKKDELYDTIKGLRAIAVKAKQRHEELEELKAIGVDNAQNGDVTEAELEKVLAMTEKIDADEVSESLNTINSKGMALVSELKAYEEDKADAEEADVAEAKPAQSAGGSYGYDFTQGAGALRAGLNDPAYAAFLAQQQFRGQQNPGAAFRSRPGIGYSDIYNRRGGGGGVIEQYFARRGGAAPIYPSGNPASYSYGTQLQDPRGRFANLPPAMYNGRSMALGGQMIDPSRYHQQNRFGGHQAMTLRDIQRMSPPPQAAAWATTQRQAGFVYNEAVPSGRFPASTGEVLIEEISSGVDSIQYNAEDFFGR